MSKSKSPNSCTMVCTDPLPHTLVDKPRILGATIGLGLSADGLIHDFLKVPIF